MLVRLVPLALAFMATAASAQGWFLHEFGELRAYHGDWLVVCENAGEGTCRAVQHDLPPGTDSFFGVSRITVTRIDGTPDWTIEVYDRQMPADRVTSLRFVFDGEPIEIPVDAWQAGGVGVPNLLETVAISDAALTAELVGKMRRENRLVVRYEPAGAGDGEAVFGLRGATSAFDAIEEHLAERQ